MKDNKRRCGTYAAALMQAFALLTIHVVSHAASPTHTDFTTSTDEQRDVQLARGVRVKLGAEAHVRLRQNGARKSIEVVAGECTFDIDARSARMLDISTEGFVVNSGKSRLAVRQDSGGIAVVVLEGTAVVRRLSERVERVRLRAGEEARFVASMPTVLRRHIDEIDRLRRLAWMQGLLWLEGEPLSTVVAQLNRVNRQRLVVGDPTLNSMLISGVFRPTEIDAFLRALAPLGVRAADPQGSEVVLVANSH